MPTYARQRQGVKVSLNYTKQECRPGRSEAAGWEFDMKTKKIGFIGTGNMGAALAKAVCAAGFPVLLYDKDTAKAEALGKELGSNSVSLKHLWQECAYIFVGVKPQVLPLLADELRSMPGDASPLLISMAAGTSIAKLEQLFGDRPIIRIMPNTSVAYGCGMVLWCCNDRVTEQNKTIFLEFMSASGRLDLIPETLIDAASALSGCGPAFVYMFMEALADGGVRCGLPRDKATLYAAQTLLGAATTLLESGKHPEALKDAVCSPGGTTIEGVRALESGGMRAAAMNAVIAAYEKTLKMK